MHHLTESHLKSLSHHFDAGYAVSDYLIVPFEEDDKDSSIWFLDHNYLENMFSMFKKINGIDNVLVDTNAYCYGVQPKSVSLAGIIQVQS